jgi:hypothetical protein
VAVGLLDVRRKHRDIDKEHAGYNAARVVRKVYIPDEMIEAITDILRP